MIDGWIVNSRWNNLTRKRPAGLAMRLFPPFFFIIFFLSPLHASPPSVCGNNVAEYPNEQCDNGAANGSPGNNCLATCQLIIPPKCGDDILQPGEQCDSRGAADNCNADCTFARCGDSKRSAKVNEQCDGGAAIALCNGDCTYSRCGDSKVNAVAGEECDEGTERVNGVLQPKQSTVCTYQCKKSFCGDGITNALVGEQCDDGKDKNGTDQSACTTGCQFVQPSSGTNTNLALAIGIPSAFLLLVNIVYYSYVGLKHGHTFYGKIRQYCCPLKSNALVTAPAASVPATTEMGQV